MERVPPICTVLIKLHLGTDTSATQINALTRLTVDGRTQTGYN